MKKKVFIKVKEHYSDIGIDHFFYEQKLREPKYIKGDKRASCLSFL